MSSNSKDISQMLENDQPAVEVVPIETGLPAFDFKESGDSPNWSCLVQGKQGGANKSGAASGLYQVELPDGGRQKIYLKQEPREHKNIIEVFTSHFMRFIAEEIGENPELFARVDFVDVGVPKKPNIYIGSYVAKGYRDLYLDAALAYHLPENRALRQGNWQILPAVRPQYIGPGSNTAYVDSMCAQGRYSEGLEAGFAIRNISEDPDVHYENLGAILPAPSDKIIPLVENGEYTQYYWVNSEADLGGAVATMTIDGVRYSKIERQDKGDYELDDFDRVCIVAKNANHEEAHYIIPARKVGLVHIDFGGACRSGLDGKIHLDRLRNFFRYFLIGGPPAYHNKLPEMIRAGREFYNTLARYSSIPFEKIEAKIDALIDEARSAYQHKPDVFTKFAEQIRDGNKNTSIKQFMKEQFKARQDAARRAFLQNFIGLQQQEQINVLRALDLKTKSTDNEGINLTRLKAFFNGLPPRDMKLIRALNTIADIDTQEHGDYLIKLRQACHRGIIRAYKSKRGLADESAQISQLFAVLSWLYSNKDLDNQEKKRLRVELFQLSNYSELFNAGRLIQQYIPEIKALDKRLKETASPRLRGKLRVLQVELQLQLIDCIKEKNPEKQDKQKLQFKALLNNTSILVEKFNTAMQAKNSDAPNLDKIYTDFAQSLRDYEGKCLKFSSGQKLLIAACSFAGALLGTLIGALVGLVSGAAIGGGAGSVAPLLGNLAGSLAGGSLGGVVAAVKGAGVGVMAGTAAGLFLLGSASSVGAGTAVAKGAGWGIFNHNNQLVKGLGRELKQELRNNEARLEDNRSFEGEKDPALMRMPGC